MTRETRRRDRRKLGHVAFQTLCNSDRGSAHGGIDFFIHFAIAEVDYRDRNAVDIFVVRVDGYTIIRTCRNFAESAGHLKTGLHFAYALLKRGTVSAHRVS